ncbi:MAG: sensor histidine kinase [Dehalococcoidia bacterium]
MKPADGAPLLAVDLEALQAAESRRLAGELHDGPVQQLTSAVLQAEVALKLLRRDPREAARSLETSRDEVRRVITQLRSLIFDLRLANVSELGLVEALRSYVEEFGRTTGLRQELRVEGQAERLPRPAEEALFLSVREALNNIHKHAQADAVRVALRFQPEHLSVRVEDNGKGFDVERALAAAARDQRFGLLSIRERAERLRGSATITSTADGGTVVEVVVPRTGEVA